MFITFSRFHPLDSLICTCLVTMCTCSLLSLSHAQGFRDYGICREQGLTFVKQPNDEQSKTPVYSAKFIPCVYLFHGSNETLLPVLWRIKRKDESNALLYLPGTMPPNHECSNSGLMIHIVDMSLDGAHYECCFDLAGPQFGELCVSDGLTIEVTNGATMAVTLQNFYWVTVTAAMLVLTSS